MRSQLEQHFREFVQEHNPPHLVATLVQSGKELALFSRGFDGVGLELVRDTQFRIASMTKCFGAAAILLLRDRGKLSLHSKVSDFVQELRDVPLWNEANIFHLLTMRTGLPTDDAWGDRCMGWSESQFSELLKSPFVFADPLGLEYHYSNLGYMLLGRVIEVAGGESALDFISNHLLLPLQMNRTSWNSSAPAAQGHFREEFALLAEADVHVESSLAVFAGLCSTVQDLARWVHFLTDAFNPKNSEFEDILSAASRRELQTPYVSVPAASTVTPVYESVEYCLGLRKLTHDTASWIGHSGGLPGYGSHFRWSIKTEIGVIALSNLRYCPVANPCRELMKSIAVASESILHPLVSERLGQLRALALDWKEELLASIFASNLCLDVNPRLLRTRLQALDLASCICVSERGLAGTLKRDGNAILFFSLAPAEGGKIQELKFL